MKKLVLKTIEIHRKGEYKWIPSSLAFYLYLSFIPLLFAILIVGIKYLNINVEVLTEYINIESFDSILKEFIGYVRGGFGNVGIIALVALLLYSIYVASGGVEGVMYASNSFFGFEQVSLIRSKILSFLVIIIILVSVLAMVLFISIVPIVFNFLNIESDYSVTFFVVLPTLYLIIHLIFYLVSNFRLKAKQIYKGALFTTIGITVLLALSSLIFTMGTTSVIYGSLAILILLGHFFLYIGYCIYFGLAINVASYELEKENQKTDKKK